MKRATQGAVRLQQDPRNSNASIEVAIQHDTSGQWSPLIPMDFNQSLRDGVNNTCHLTSGLNAKLGGFRIVLRILEDFVWDDRANCLKIKLAFDEGRQVDEYPIIALRPGPDAEDLRKKSRATDMIGMMEKDTYGALCFTISLIVLPQSITEDAWFEAGFVFQQIGAARFEPNRKPSQVNPNRLARLRVDVLPSQFLSFKSSSIPVYRRAAESQLDKSRKVTIPPDVTLEAKLIFNTDVPKSEPRAPKVNENAGHKNYTFNFLYREEGHYDPINDVELVDERLRIPGKDHIERGPHTTDQTSATGGKRLAENVQKPKRLPNLRGTPGTAISRQPRSWPAVKDGFHRISTPRESEPNLFSPVRNESATSSLSDVFRPRSRVENLLASPSASNQEHRSTTPSGLRQDLARNRSTSDTLNTPMRSRSASFRDQPPTGAEHGNLMAQNSQCGEPTAAQDSLEEMEPQPQNEKVPHPRYDGSQPHRDSDQTFRAQNAAAIPILEALNKASELSQQRRNKQDVLSRTTEISLKSIRAERTMIKERKANVEEELEKLNKELQDITLCDDILRREEEELDAMHTVRTIDTPRKLAIFQALKSIAEELVHVEQEELKVIEDSVKKAQKRRRSQLSASLTSTIDRDRKRRNIERSFEGDNDSKGRSDEDGEVEGHEPDDGAHDGLVGDGG